MVDHLFGREPKGLPARARSIAEAIAVHGIAMSPRSSALLRARAKRK
jgi:hypothetical protein